jgi:hypothetical protein
LTLVLAGLPSGVKYRQDSRSFRTSEEGADPSAWSEEIKRRIAELDSGKVKPIPWEEARRQIAALLNGR